jgi:hypothetical protein
MEKIIESWIKSAESEIIIHKTNKGNYYKVYCGQFNHQYLRMVELLTLEEVEDFKKQQ